MDYEIVIKLKDVRSVPEVYINGERIRYLVDLSLNWQTKDAYDLGYCGYEIVHFTSENPVRVTMGKEFGEKKEGRK